jgi:hypothetical protein
MHKLTKKQEDIITPLETEKTVSINPSKGHS